MSHNYLFRCGSWNGAVIARVDFTETAIANNNTYFNADRPLEGMGEFQNGENAFFSNELLPEGWKNAYPNLTFTQWQSHPGSFNIYGPQDVNSTWQQVDTTPLDQLDPTLNDGQLMPPTDLVDVADGMKVTITWQDNNDEEDGYIVHRKPWHRQDQWHESAVLSADTTSYIDSESLFGLVEYTYRVGAFKY